MRLVRLCNDPSTVVPLLALEERAAKLFDRLLVPLMRPSTPERKGSPGALFNVGETDVTKAEGKALLERRGLSVDAESRVGGGGDVVGGRREVEGSGLEGEAVG
jgi:hypothetical protein